MPNHVINEVVITGGAELLDRVLARVGTKMQAIDFEGLLPLPLNVWPYSAGQRHDQVFKPQNIALEWCRQNWGTKWNAYGLSDVGPERGNYQSIVRANDRLTLTFQTAWGAPYGWLLALHRAFDLNFDYGYLSEGGEAAHVGQFRMPVDDDFTFQPWVERDADDAEQRRFHKLLWGVEQFDGESA